MHGSPSVPGSLHEDAAATLIGLALVAAAVLMEATWSDHGDDGLPVQ